MWNTANAMTMAQMFEDSNFNGNISEWNVSTVKSMSGMVSTRSMKCLRTQAAFGF